MLNTKMSDATLGQYAGVGAMNAGIGAVTGLAGQWVNSLFNEAQSKREYERQKEFAQNSIQWRVQDAMKAGIHPLAALGSQGINYSPVVDTESDYGGAIERAGQAFQSSMDRYMQNKMFQKSEAEIGLVEAQTAYYNALAQKTMQPEVTGQKPAVSAPIKKEQDYDKSKPISQSNFSKQAWANVEANGVYALPKSIELGKDGARFIQNNDGTYELVGGQGDSDSGDSNAIEYLRGLGRSLGYRFNDHTSALSYIMRQESKLPLVVEPIGGGKYVIMRMETLPNGRQTTRPLPRGSLTIDNTKHNF